MKRKSGLKFKTKTRGNGDVSLNITAMADIFVVLLVFLLKSFTSGAMTVMPTANISLPAASMKSEHVEALKIEISQTDLVIEGKQILPLSEYQFPANDLNKSGFSNKLFESIQEIKKNETVPTANVIILADRKVPYSALKIIMASAAGAGLTNFKLAVRSLED